MEYFAAAMAAVQGISSLFGGSAAAKAAEKQAKAEAQAERVATQERVRQIDRRRDIMQGQTLAGAAGAGVKVGSQSVLAVMADQAAEFEREREIVGKVGASKARSALGRGEAIATQARYQSYTDLFGSFARAGSILGGL